MEIIASNLRTSDPDFRDNQARMGALVRDMKDRMAQVRAGGGERQVELHRSRGKLLARERIDALVDANTPFLELSPLAAWDMYDGEESSAGIVTGVGVVQGKEVVVVANDATVKGGTYYSDHRQEAPARPGNCPGKPPALHLSGGFRRSLFAIAGGGIPRPGPLRAHLLQPGADVGPGHTAGGGSHGVLHGRRRVYSGHER